MKVYSKPLDFSFPCFFGGVLNLLRGKTKRGHLKGLRSGHNSLECGLNGFPLPSFFFFLFSLFPFLSFLKDSVKWTGNPGRRTPNNERSSNEVSGQKSPAAPIIILRPAPPPPKTCGVDKKGVLEMFWNAVSILCSLYKVPSLLCFCASRKSSIFTLYFRRWTSVKRHLTNADDAEKETNHPQRRK